MRALLCVLFFASGASALLFETLWFRGAGLALGSGVRASTVVLSAFMAGLALGNALAARRADGLRRPLVAYGVLELIVGAAGLGIVVLLPHASTWLAQVAGAALERPALRDALRLLLAFALLVVPATAMGMTLPTVVRARGGDVGAALGSLYGWNTLGAVCGALAGEAWLIERVGVPGTALVAAGVNLLAAGVALAVGLRLEPAWVEPAAPPEPDARPATRLLLAAALSGAALLALEVLWFRHLLLFVRGTSTVFAVLLAVVLLGIGAGGLAGGWWLASRPRDHRGAAGVALAAGAATALALLAFRHQVGGQPLGPWATFRLAAPLIFPTAFLSGVLFTLLGAAVHARAGAGAARAVGRLTLWNTTGAIAGSALAGLVVLPTLGVGRGLLLVTTLYGLVALLCGPGRGLLAPLALWAAAVALFPSARLREQVAASARAYVGPGCTVLAAREGREETLAIVRQDLAGEPLFHRLVTNGYSMAATDGRSRRYMELFARLPLEAHPDVKDALLVCYGTGSTAAALVRHAGLRRLDVVDLSPDVLALDQVVRPRRQESPLSDPRVRVHVEDGRFFLAAARQEYDLITAEPPPPKLAGVVNLYTREYFALARARLRPGGFCTHWLPVHSLSRDDARAIVAAFVEAFPGATLWEGAGLDWVLVGRRDAPAPLRAGSSGEALAGPRALVALAGGAPPLVDAFPLRLSPDLAAAPWDPFAWVGVDPETPERVATLGPVPASPSLVRRALSDPVLLWLLASGEDEVRAVERAAARGVTGAEVDRHLGAAAFAAGRYLEAARRWERLPGYEGLRGLALDLAR